MSDPESMQFYIMLSAYRLSLIPTWACSRYSAVMWSSSDLESKVCSGSLTSGTKVAELRLTPNLDVLGEV